MSFATRHNKGTLFNVDTTGYEYVKPTDLLKRLPEDTVYQIAGLFVNSKGKFGSAPVAIVPEYQALVNLPAHMTEEVFEILGNASDVEAINNGLVGIQFERYTSRRYNPECIGVNWVDL